MDSLSELAKQYPTLSTVLAFATLLGVVDGVFGGFGRIRAIWGFLTRGAPETYYLEYRNLDRRVKIDPASRGQRGLMTVQMETVLINDNDFPLYTIPSTMTSHLNGLQPPPLAEPRRIMKVVRGVDTLLADGPIAIKIPSGGLAEGRIDWVIKYGRNPEKLDKLLTIKGSVAIDGNGKFSRMTWVPDDDSDTPSGMKSLAVERADRKSPHATVRGVR